MAHFLKCTDKDGKEVFINFDHVYQMKRLRLPERKGGKEITELVLMDPSGNRVIEITDPPDSLDRQLRG
jgi:hypothetical protein